LFEDLETEPSWQPAEWVGIAPGTGARLLLAGRTIGYIGRIAATETAFPLFAAEILLDEIPHAAAAVQVRPPSRFPGIAADLTLTHDVAVSWTALAAAIEEHRAPELASFALKDRYQGAGVPAGAVATTIAFHYNAGERSLTQDEVNARHAVLSAELERRFAAGRKENR
jgi:phenylalanyl-tRNA synthetase beta chain